MLPHREVPERTGSGCIEPIVMRRVVLHPVDVVPIHDERLPNIIMHGEMVVGKAAADRSVKRPRRGVAEYCSEFGVNATSWKQVAPNVSERYRIAEEGGTSWASTESQKP